VPTLNPRPWLRHGTIFALTLTAFLGAQLTAGSQCDEEDLRRAAILAQEEEAQESKNPNSSDIHPLKQLLLDTQYCTEKKVELDPKTHQVTKTVPYSQSDYCREKKSLLSRINKNGDAQFAAYKKNSGNPGEFISRWAFSISEQFKVGEVCE
jgi:hypothetical protein